MIEQEEIITLYNVKCMTLIVFSKSVIKFYFSMQHLTDHLCLRKTELQNIRRNINLFFLCCTWMTLIVSQKYNKILFFLCCTWMTTCEFEKNRWHRCASAKTYICKSC